MVRQRVAVSVLRPLDSAVAGREIILLKIDISDRLMPQFSSFPAKYAHLTATVFLVQRHSVHHCTVTFRNVSVMETDVNDPK